MNVLDDRRRSRPSLAGISRWFGVAVVATALAAGCDHPFQPHEENRDAIFSMFGYLDLKADTQWVRVMPVRQNLLLGPDPVDAIVTLEHLGSGRVVTLNDSLFSFTDRQLDGLAYAYNFWTTERLEPGASYRLRAARSDGASTTATVEMPADFEFSVLNDRRFGADYAVLQIRAERVLFVDLVHTMATTFGGPAPSVAVRQPAAIPTNDPGTHRLGVRADTSSVGGFLPVGRSEIRVAVANSGWPFHLGLSDLFVSLPGTMPSNVENGVGFVGGVSIWTIPFHLCEVLAERPDGEPACLITFSARSPSIEGRVIRQPCGDPHSLADIRLTESFAGGGTVVRTWKTGWDGSYRFEGIEPDADLALELTPGTPPVQLPRLAPGEGYILEDVAVPGGC
jgi:hypothetical protein